MCGAASCSQRNGSENVKVMIPFCRTVEEGRRVVSEMALHGLRQGEDRLEIYAMCELPSNVMLAAEFLKVFDGFSIGSNDLTTTRARYPAGIPEQSLDLFDERNGAVLRMIADAIDAAHRAHKHRNVRPGAFGLSGICSVARRQEHSFNFAESGRCHQNGFDRRKGGVRAQSSDPQPSLLDCRRDRRVRTGSP